MDCQWRTESPCLEAGESETEVLASSLQAQPCMFQALVAWCGDIDNSLSGTGFHSSLLDDNIP